MHTDKADSFQLNVVGGGVRNEGFNVGLDALSVLLELLFTDVFCFVHFFPFRTVRLHRL